MKVDASITSNFIFSHWIILCSLILCLRKNEWWNYWNDLFITAYERKLCKSSSCKVHVIAINMGLSNEIVIQICNM